MSGTGRRPAWRREAVAFLELAALSGFVVAQPVFQLLSGASDYLVFRQVEGGEIVAVAVALCLLPPAVLWLVGLGARLLSPPVGRIVHLAFLGGLVALFGLQMLRRVEWMAPAGRVAAALALGVAGGAVYARWAPARLWTRFASPAPVLFAALFLLATPVAGLLHPAPVPAVDAVTTESAPPVVLMVFDELPVRTLLAPGGEIDARLYPNFAALAGDATFFRNTTTVAARTMHAVPSILTGRFPRRDVAPTVAQYPENLFSLLQGSHQVHAVESVAALCPASACPVQERRDRRSWGLFGDAARVWAHTVAPSAPGDDPLGNWFWEEVGETAGRPERFERFLASIDGEGNPFHFVHVLLPHAPWRYLPDGLQYEPRELGLVSYDERTDEAWPAVVDRQRHVLQAMYVDTLLGEALARLREVGLYDQATVVVTADHGVSFQTGIGAGTRNLLPGNAHEVAFVPLLIKAPGQTEGAVSDDSVMTVDVAPTVAELVGVSLPWAVDGTSLVSGPRRETARVLFNHPGVAIELDDAGPYGEVLAGMAEDLGRPARGAAGMFVVGPFQDMIGSLLASFDVVEEPAMTGWVDGLQAYDAVDLASGTVPALVAGHLDMAPGAEAPGGVAVVVNGTVAAVSSLYAEGHRSHRFAAMVWPGWMQEGRNTLELYLVDAGDPSVLRGISVEPA